MLELGWSCEKQISKYHVYETFMYNTHSKLLDIKFWKKHFLSIIHIDVLEFLEVKLIENLSFIRLFIQYVLTKNKNVYSL